MGALCVKSNSHVLDTVRLTHGGGQKLGSASNSDTQSKLSPRSARLKAAESRQQASKNISGVKKDEIRTQRVKDELLGKIELMYSQLGREAPFGIRSADVPTLRRALKRLESERRLLKQSSTSMMQ